MEPIFNYDTKNISFIETSKELKSLGVRCCEFMLVLYNKHLKDIDPHDSGLDDCTKVQIIKECELNPWYYLREVARIPVHGGSTRPFELHRGNLAIIYLSLIGVSTYSYLPAMCGKTISTLCMLSYIKTIKGITNIGLTSHQDFSTSRLNHLLKSIDDNLPEYFSMINIPPNNDTILNLYDDIEFMDNFKDIYKGDTTNIVNIITSTPGDLNSESCRFGKAIFDKGVPFTESIYDMTMLELFELTKDNVVSIKFQYDQLRRDDNWFNERCAAYGNKADVIQRELLLQHTM